jgi:hypothetical protein
VPQSNTLIAAARSLESPPKQLPVEFQVGLQQMRLATVVAPDGLQTDFAAGLAFYDGGHAHTAGRADGNEAAPLAAFRQQFGECSHQARARGGEGVPDSQAAANDIQLRRVDGAERLPQP